MDTPERETFPVPPGPASVACDGGHGALGHPVVWYPLGPEPGAQIVCWYCSRVFVREA